MDYSTGKIAFIVIVAVAMACAAAWVLAWRYRAAMKAFMSAPQRSASVAAPEMPAPTGAPVGLGAPPARVSVDANRRAGWRLTLLLIALSVLIALSSAALTLRFAAGDGNQFTLKRLAVLAFVHAWPVLPALGLLWRWSTLRILGVLLGWCVLCFAVVLWRSIEPRPHEVLMFLAGEIGAPLLLVALLCLGSVTRAAAPWLLPPLVGLVWASIAGIDLLAVLVDRGTPWLFAFPSWFIPYGVMVLFALLPWVLAWWPLRRLGRALGHAYARKQLSELMVLFTAVWAISLLVQALSVASDLGLSGTMLLLPLLWIPVVMAVWPRPQPQGRPPTLLVLRVFQHDAQVQALYDHVVERWRLTGNTVLIAGTDLVERTLDAQDIFTFLDGGLGQRFIMRPADVAPRLAAFDMAPDAEGRFRVNECYCHDSAWQQALFALEERSDVVLMDLRGFQAHNAGCRFELGTLAASQHLSRVVVLVDANTDRACAEAEAAHAPAGRFVWLNASTIDAARRREVLRSLFVP